MASTRVDVAVVMAPLLRVVVGLMVTAKWLNEPGSRVEAKSSFDECLVASMFMDGQMSLVTPYESIDEFIHLLLRMGSEIFLVHAEFFELLTVLLYSHAP